MRLAVLVLLCFLIYACTSQAVESMNEDDFASAPISFRGTTELRVRGLQVSIPASAMPSGITGCRVQAEQKGRSGDYGLELDEPVWDVNIYCDREDIRELFDVIKVCISPDDSVIAGKWVLQRHGENFVPLPLVQIEEGYVCGEAEGLSLFTIGLDTRMTEGVGFRAESLGLEELG
jgi:hypothetical protein